MEHISRSDALDKLLTMTLSAMQAVEDEIQV